MAGVAWHAVNLPGSCDMAARTERGFVLRVFNTHDRLLNFLTQEKSQREWVPFFDQEHSKKKLATM